MTSCILVPLDGRCNVDDPQPEWAVHSRAEPAMHSLRMRGSYVYFFVWKVRHCCLQW